jgi:hypothetical protein
MERAQLQPLALSRCDRLAPQGSSSAPFAIAVVGPDSYNPQYFRVMPTTKAVEVMAAVGIMFGIDASALRLRLRGMPIGIHQTMSSVRACLL